MEQPNWLERHNLLICNACVFHLTKFYMHLCSVSHLLIILHFFQQRKDLKEIKFHHSILFLQVQYLLHIYFHQLMAYYYDKVQKITNFANKPSFHHYLVKKRFVLQINPGCRSNMTNQLKHNKYNNQYIFTVHAQEQWFSFVTLMVLI